MRVLKKGVRTGWAGLFALSASVGVLWTAKARALPALSCQTVSLSDPDGVIAQLGKTELIETLKQLSLTYVAEPTAADVLLNFEFFSASGRIVAKMRTWTESEPQLVDSEPIRWHEDFAARRRVIEPLEKAEAERFRVQILEQLQALLGRHVSAIALGSEPEGLVVTVDRPAGARVPLERDRTVALLGCLSEGEEVTGFVSWPDGHREPFKERASQNPGRVILHRAEIPIAEEPASAEEQDPDDLVRIEQAVDSAAGHAPAKPQGRSWGLAGGALVALLAAAATLAAIVGRKTRK